MRQPYPSAETPAAARFIGGFVAFIFACIGLTVLIFLWSAPFGAFGSPPLFFRVFGSFIALVFVVMGGGGAIAAIRGKMPTGPQMRHMDVTHFQQPHTPAPGAPPRTPQGGYACPHCAAPLGNNADVSPLGDAKCTFCGTWFNIHGRRS